MQARFMNPVVLAYIGDGVHTLYVREKLAFSSDVKSNVLQKKESKLVCATAQARAINGLLTELNEEEVAIYKRARNAKKGSKAKNSTAGDYGYYSCGNIFDYCNNKLCKRIRKTDVWFYYDGVCDFNRLLFVRRPCKSRKQKF